MDFYSLISNSFYALSLPFVILAIFLIVMPFSFLLKFTTMLYRRFFDMENLNGKVALITGASSGIGEQLAYEYARKGASIAIVARRENQLFKVAEAARKLGFTNVLPICGDVTKIEDCKRFVNQTVKHFGRLDHLVNNAGIGGVSTLEDAKDVTNFAPVMDVNFWGSIYTTYYAIPHLRKTRGKIVVNSSATAWLRPPRLAFYAASKAAMLTFYETMRAELGSSITITTVTLGIVESELSQGKHLNKDGKFLVDQQVANEIYHGLPAMSARASAEAIVDAVRLGKRNVTEPKMFKLLHLLATLCPELIQWYFTNFYYRPKNLSQE